jgi:hypothetical protein
MRGETGRLLSDEPSVGVDEPVEVATEERRRLVERERSATTAGTLGLETREDPTWLAAFAKEGFVGFLVERAEPETAGSSSTFLDLTSRCLRSELGLILLLLVS